MSMWTCKIRQKSNDCSLISIDLVVESRQAYQNECKNVRISYFILTIFSTLLNRDIPPLNEGMYTRRLVAFLPLSPHHNWRAQTDEFWVIQVRTVDGCREVQSHALLACLVFKMMPCIGMLQKHITHHKMSPSSKFCFEVWQCAHLEISLDSMYCHQK